MGRIFTLLFIAGLAPGTALAGGFPPPVVTDVSPSSAVAGSTLDVTVSGSDFLNLPLVSFGEQVTVNSTIFVDSTTLLCNITIDEQDGAGLRDVRVINPDLQNGILVAGFEIIGTRLHYVDPMASAVHPFTSPLTAANTFDQVLTAAGIGDSILIVSDTVSATNANIHRSLTVLGGWDATFTTRDPINAKSVLQVAPTVVVREGPGLPPVEYFPSAIFDGIVFENGTGQTSPTRTRGGALYSSSSPITLRHCEFRNNQAVSVEADWGGAVYVSGTSLIATDCYFHDNYAAGNGGAIMVSSGEVELTGNIFERNTADFAGGALYFTGCPSVLLQDNDFDDNSGVLYGGSVYSTKNDSFVMSGGRVSNSHATSWGGALYLFLYGGDADISGVEFENYSAGEYGSAIRLASYTTARLAENRFLGGNVGIGGAIYAEGGTLELDHNLMTANDGPIPCVMVLNLTGGRILGNTITNNLGPGPMLSISNSAIDVRNNILAHHPGAGVICSGVTFPTDVAYNCVYDTGAAAYTGCGPGTGALSADPLFVDVVGGDFHLGAHSAAIDAGDPSGLLLDPDGRRGDMGCYGSHAFVTPVPMTPATPAAQSVAGDVVVSWPTHPEGDIDQIIVYGGTTSDFVPGAASVRAVVGPLANFANVGPAAGDSWFRLAVVDLDGYSSGFSDGALIDVTDADEATSRTRVLGSHPNPFNPRTSLHFEIARAAHVQLFIHDVRGRLVRRLVDEPMEAGRYVRPWDGRDDIGESVASGAYIYRLESAGEVSTGRMVLLK